MGSEDAEAHEVCRANREGLTQQFRRALDNDVARGLLADVDTRSLALSLMAQTYGILLMGKNGASRESLQAVADITLASIACS